MKPLTILILFIITFLNSTAQVKHNFDNNADNSKINNSQPVLKNFLEYQKNTRLFNPEKEKVNSKKIKSATTEKHQLDSVIYETYNISGEWIENIKNVPEYDSVGNQIHNTIYRWNEEDGRWINLTKIDFIPNSEGKVVQEIHYKPNSVDNSWVNDYKYEYEYDSEGNRILDARYGWNSTSENWFGTLKHVYGYDATGNQILNILYDRNIYNNGFTEVKKYEYRFDMNGKKTMEAYFVWDVIDHNTMIWGWRNEYVEESTFNEKGQLTLFTKGAWSKDSTVFHKQTKNEIQYNFNDSILQQTTYNWIELDSMWKEVDLENYIYTTDATIYNRYTYNYNLDSLIKTEAKETNFNANGDIISYIKYYRSSQLDSIVPDTKVEYTYYPAGNQIFETLAFKYDIDSKSWIPISKMENSTYDTHENPTQIIESINWDKGLEEWLNVTKFNYNYNSSDELTLLETNTWDKNLNNWLGITKFEYSFDENNNLVSGAKYIWDSSLNDWKGDNKSDYIFDSNYTYDDLILPNYGDMILPYWASPENFQNMLTQTIIYSWNDSTNNWYEKEVDTYYYSSIIIDKIDKQLLRPVNIYPNPTKDYITVSNLTQPAHLELYSIKGNKIQTVQVMVNTPVSITSLNPGIYIYKLFTGDKHYSGKLIKK